MLQYTGLHCPVHVFTVVQCHMEILVSCVFLLIFCEIGFETVFPERSTYYDNSMLKS